MYKEIVIGNNVIEIYSNWIWKFFAAAKSNQSLSTYDRGANQLSHAAASIMPLFDNMFNSKYCVCNKLSKFAYCALWLPLTILWHDSYFLRFLIFQKILTNLNLESVKLKRIPGRHSLISSITDSLYYQSFLCAEFQFKLRQLIFNLGESYPLQVYKLSLCLVSSMYARN
jgi:hypothetical protein